MTSGRSLALRSKVFSILPTNSRRFPSSPTYDTGIYGTQTLGSNTTPSTVMWPRLPAAAGQSHRQIDQQRLGPEQQGRERNKFGSDRKTELWSLPCKCNIIGGLQTIKDMSHISLDIALE